METRTAFQKAIAERLEEEFTPPGTPQYNPAGDFLTVFFSEDEAYIERIDDVLTIFRSTETHELIGCKIKGVTLLAKNVESLIHIEDGEIELRLLLLNALGPKQAKEYYYDVGNLVADLKVTASQLKLAA